jgi:hypothetical protein
MPTDPSSERFVIIGSPRSGAVSILRLLTAAGCHRGRPHRFAPADGSHPQGRAEHLVVEGVNRRILEEMGAARTDPLPALTGVAAPVIERFRGPVRRALAELEPLRPWAVDDPALSFTLPAWREVMGNAAAVIALRDPLEVARMRARTEPAMTVEAGLAEWEAYTVAAVNASTGMARTVIDRRELLTDPGAVLGRLREVFGLDTGPAGAVVGDILRSNRPITGVEAEEASDGALPAPVAALHRRLSAEGPPEGERIEVSDRSLEILERRTRPGRSVRRRDRRVAVLVRGRLDPVGSRATALVRRSWATHDLDGADVFFCFADPVSEDGRWNLGGFLPGHRPDLTEGAVIGHGDVIVAACGDDDDPEAALLGWLLALSHLVESAGHDAYLLVDPFTHVDLERLLVRVDDLGRRAVFEWASLDPDGEDDPGASQILISRAVAERLVAAAADVVASAGGTDPVAVLAEWLAAHVPEATVSHRPTALADLRGRSHHEQTQRARAVGHRFAVGRVHELEWFHDRYHAHLDPGFAAPPTANVAANDLIFVQIPSYRDPELPKTINSMLAAAAAPERLRVGICWQYDEWTATDLDPWLDDPRFRIDEVYYRHARGCSWARARVNQLYDGEGYTLQIDSHMRFGERWDERLIAMLEGIEARKPLLTTYPPGYFYDGDGTEVLNTATGVQRVAVRDLGPNLTAAQGGEVVPDTSRPGPAFHLAGGFVFAHGQFVVDVPSDALTYFNGEELALAARAFTHGYDLHYPNENLIWHLYYQPAPKHWGDSRVWPKLDEIAVDRIRTLLIGDHTSLGDHGLGSVRTIADFERHAGLDLRASRHQLPAPKLVVTRIAVDTGELDLEAADDCVRLRIRLLDDGCDTVHVVDVFDPAVLRGEVSTHVVEALVTEPPVSYSLRVEYPGGWGPVRQRPVGAVPEGASSWKKP